VKYTRHQKGGQYLKKRRIIPLVAFILAVYFLFIKDKFPVVDALPTVIEEEFIVMLNEKRNYVYLEKDGEEQSIGIAIDDEKTLYIANPIGNNITKFTVNKDKNEIYIKKSVINYQTGDNDKFQLIEVPYSKYKVIISENKVNVYIDYGLGYESREYNLTNSEYKTLEYIEPTK
jgi:hypothetical protein